MKVLHNNLLIKPDAKEQTTKSGIILSNTEADVPEKGVVVEKSFNISEVNKGDHVIFRKYAGVETDIEDKDYLILDIKDILAIIEY